MSKNKLNQLGQRLAEAGRPSPDDLRLLHTVIRYYQAVLDGVKEELDALGFSEASSRVKTQGTLIEKLQREHGMNLARVQDFAGARIVVEGGRREQDEVVQKLIEHFSEAHPKEPRAIDRRANPSFGYRAVHIIVHPTDVPVEIQVRTSLQNSWAQTMEGLADRWGRGIRYGQPPDEPSKIVKNLGRTSLTRRQLVDRMRRLSESIAAVERHAEVAAAAKTMLDCLHDRDADGFFAAVDSMSEALENRLPAPPPLREEDFDAENLVATYRAFRNGMKRGIHVLVGDRRRAGRIMRRHIPRRTEVTREEFRTAIAFSMAVSMNAVRKFHQAYSRHSQSVRSSMVSLERVVEDGGLE